MWTAVFNHFDRRSIARVQVASLVLGFIGMILVFFPASSWDAQADLSKPFELLCCVRGSGYLGTWIDVATPVAAHDGSRSRS